MITKCIALFNLLPTSQPHHWLIAADWLEENEKYTEANAFRESFFRLEMNSSKFPNGVFCGHGDGINGGEGESNDDAGSGNGYGGFINFYNLFHGDADGNYDICENIKSNGSGCGFGDGNGHGYS